MIVVKRNLFANRGRLVTLALLTALAFLSQGCVALQVRHPLPEHLLAQAGHEPRGSKEGDVDPRRQ